MADFSKQEFLMEQQRALERMREMNRRSKFEGESHKMPPTPSFVRVQNSKGDNTAPDTPPKKYKHEKKDNSNSLLGGFMEGGLGSIFSGGSSLPFSQILKKDKDTALILGLILILSSEKSDRLLLLALLYILI